MSPRRAGGGANVSPFVMLSVRAGSGSMTGNRAQAGAPRLGPVRKESAEPRMACAEFDEAAGFGVVVGGRPAPLRPPLNRRGVRAIAPDTSVAFKMVGHLGR
jgi:hypothetical protein